MGVRTAIEAMLASPDFVFRMEEAPSGIEVGDSYRISDADLATRHVRAGWTLLLVFMIGGLVLETLHGFKIDFYLNVQQGMTRLMWTLSHATGTVLGLVHIAFAFTCHVRPVWPLKQRALASTSLMSASIYGPAGLFLAGVFAKEGRPGLGILLLPPGLLLLVITAYLSARWQSNTAESS